MSSHLSHNARKTRASKNSTTKNLGPVLQVCQLNIENISLNKCEYLQKILTEHNIDVVALQETHTSSDQELLRRGKIAGYKIVAAVHHQAWGIATYVRSDIEDVKVVQCSDNNNIQIITITIAGITLVNLYKPPGVVWSRDSLPNYHHPVIYIGDFNSRHPNWGYRSSNSNGDMLQDWMDSNNLYSLFNAKDKGTFRSARWGQDYNPDMTIVSTNSNNLPLPATRKILNTFPRSQHRTIIITIGTIIRPHRSIPKPRWNLQKANWLSFTKHLDHTIKWIKPIPSNYDRFAELVISTAKKFIPRGCRQNYIPGWSDDCENLYNEIHNNGKEELTDELFDMLNKARSDKWKETTENLNFTHTSRTAWSLLRKLEGTSKSSIPNANPPHPDQIASRLVSNSKINIPKQKIIEVKQNLTAIKKSHQQDSEFIKPFELHELDNVIGSLKLRKAAGPDKILPEFVKHFGPNAKCWLIKLFNAIVSNLSLPKAFKTCKIIAIAKPGKPTDSPENYRPIALLSIVYKILEKLIYERIFPIINEYIPPEQAGFRPNRSCCDQVLALTSFIEYGYENEFKTATAFIDLSSAYDTVWKHGVLLKLYNAIPCKRLMQLINCFLSDRLITVHLAGKESKTRHLQNGLPQGSVLAPLLFNLYTMDYPTTFSKKFIYADDMCLATHCKTLEEGGHSLTKDLNTLNDYFSLWGLKPNPQKTEVCAFHLNNREANKQLNVRFKNVTLNHNFTPKYLGVTLDRTLSFGAHTEKVGSKLKTRINLIHKLAGTTWGSDANTLKTATLGLVYSTAEYCAPVWMNSAHVKKIDIHLNQAMRTVSGTIKSTPLPWLPVLSNISPPEIRRTAASLREINKIDCDPSLPIHEYLLPETKRLKSRKPFSVYARNIQNENLRSKDRWKRSWSGFDGPNHDLISDPTEKVPGFTLHRKSWCTLNRLRTQHGRCGALMYKWGYRDSPECTCGHPHQTMEHIIADCPITSFEGTIEDIHNLTTSALDWIKTRAPIL